jgi:fimbrial chaperone protein
VLCGYAQANSLTVSPVLVDVVAPRATTTVTLESSGPEQINAQVRVFKWTIVDGKDKLVPTKDVVASPPAVKVKANGKAVIRLVRRSKQPVGVEENYRLLVSQVPSAPKVNQGVGIAFQYSIPAFFTPKGSEPSIQWSAAASKGNLVVKAVNTGGRRLRVANLEVKKGGKSYQVGGGISGYVLANSTRLWVVKGGAKGLKNGSTVQIVAEGDFGDVDTTAVVGAAN